MLAFKTDFFKAGNVNTVMALMWMRAHVFWPSFSFSSLFSPLWKLLSEKGGFSFWIKAWHSSQMRLKHQENENKNMLQLHFYSCCFLFVSFSTHFCLIIEKRGTALLPCAMRRVIYSKELVKILIGASGCKSQSEAPSSSTETSVISPPPSAFQEVASPTFCAFSSVSCHMKANGEAPLSATAASITARREV